MSQQEQESVVEIKIQPYWNPADIPATQPANQFIAQNTPAGEVVLTLGFLDGPVTYGSADEQLQQARRIAKDGLQIQPVVRVVMTPLVARQLQDALANQARLAEQRHVQALKSSSAVQ